IDPSAGGTATALVALARAQARAGLRVSVVSTFRDHTSDAAAASLRADNVAVTEIGPVTGPLMRRTELTKPLRDHIAGADLVHIHALWEEIQHRAAREARRASKPYVITPHGMLDP